MSWKPLAGLTVLLLVITVAFGLHRTNAQETGGTGFRVSPSRYAVDTDPETVFSRQIVVTNLTNTTQKAIPVVNDFVPSQSENGSPQLVVDSDGSENPRSIQPFVLPLTEFVLTPGESRNVDVTFDIPGDASPGAYYGVVRFVAEGPEEDTDGESNVALTASVGTVFLINVEGDTVQLMFLEEIGAAKEPGGEIKGFFSSPPAVSVIRLSNQGNTFEAPFGTVSVKDWRGNVVYSYELNEGEPRGNVLPGSIRRFEDNLENIGSFGRYTIEGFISYGDGGSIIEAKTTFWVVPWAQLLVGASVIIALFFLGTRGVKAYNARVVSKSKKGY